MGALQVHGAGGVHISGDVTAGGPDATFALISGQSILRPFASQDQGIVTVEATAEALLVDLMAFTTLGPEVPELLQLPPIFVEQATFRIVRYEPLKFRFIED